jgi:hypothetical protein
MAGNTDGPAVEPDDAAGGTSEPRWFQRHVRLVVVMAAVLVISTMGGASAAALITGRQIKDGTVTGRDIRDHSLRPKDAKPGVVRPGPAGPEGVAGPSGPAGPIGPPGRNGLGGLVTIVSPTPFAVPGDQTVDSDLACPSGLSALGGGASGADATAVYDMALTMSAPTKAGLRPDGWTVGVHNFGASDIGVYVWVQCAPI